jgi:hypothetical protein
MALPQAQIAQLPGVELVREDTRRTIAITAIASYFVILGLLVLGGWLTSKPVDEIERLVAVTAAVLGGVVGAVVGFYFQADKDE